MENSLELIEISSTNKVSLVRVSSCSNTGSIRDDPYWTSRKNSLEQGSNFIAAIAAIALEGEQNAVDHCGNDGNFLPYSAIFILFTVHYYFDT
jgi:hypothetical protein